MVRFRLSRRAHNSRTFKSSTVYHSMLADKYVLKDDFLMSLYHRAISISQNFHGRTLTEEEKDMIYLWVQQFHEL